MEVQARSGPGGVADGGVFTSKACMNCGATQNLLKCSRCHQAWFCSVQCQKAYWPFHKSVCRRNDFADAIESTEPKFASWMRKHGKIAVLKDDEVERLERASKSGNGTKREDVMRSMYGRADPKPLAPSYTPEDLRRMGEAQERRALEATGTASIADAAWAAIDIPRDLGLDCGPYKWCQTQAQVFVYVKLPPQPFSKYSAFGKSSKVEVMLEPTAMRVSWGGEELLGGELCREIKCDESTWFVSDGVVELALLKRYRRGLAYAKGETNANTYWKSVFANPEEKEALQVNHPPSKYYDTEWRMEEGGDGGGPGTARRSRRALAANKVKAEGGS